MQQKGTRTAGVAPSPPGAQGGGNARLPSPARLPPPPVRPTTQGVAAQGLAGANQPVGQCGSSKAPPGKSPLGKSTPSGRPRSRSGQQQQQPAASSPPPAVPPAESGSSASLPVVPKLLHRSGSFGDTRGARREATQKARAAAHAQSAKEEEAAEAAVFEVAREEALQQAYLAAGYDSSGNPPAAVHTQRTARRHIGPNNLPGQSSFIPMTARTSARGMTAHYPQASARYSARSGGYAQSSARCSTSRTCNGSPRGEERPPSKPVVGWRKQYTKMLWARAGAPTGLEACTQDALLNALREVVLVRGVDCLPDVPEGFDPSIHATVGDVAIVKEHSTGMHLRWNVLKAETASGRGGGGGGGDGRGGGGGGSAVLSAGEQFTAGAAFDPWGEQEEEDLVLVDLPKGDGITDGFSSILRMLRERRAALSVGVDTIPPDEPLFAHEDGSAWTVGEVRDAVKASAKMLGLDPDDFAERSLNIGGKTEMTGAGKMHRSGARSPRASPRGRGMASSREDATARC